MSAILISSGVAAVAAAAAAAFWICGMFMFPFVYRSPAVMAGAKWQGRQDSNLQCQG